MKLLKILSTLFVTLSLVACGGDKPIDETKSDTHLEKGEKIKLVQKNNTEDINNQIGITQKEREQLESNHIFMVDEQILGKNWGYVIDSLGYGDNSTDENVELIIGLEFLNVSDKDIDLPISYGYVKDKSNTKLIDEVNINEITLEPVKSSEQAFKSEISVTFKPNKKAQKYNEVIDIKSSEGTTRIFLPERE